MSRAIDEIARNEARSYDYSCSLQRDHDDQRSLLTSLGELFTRGIDVDFESLVPDGQVVATPLYAYQRKRFWFSERNRLHRPRPVHPLLGARSQSSIDPRLYSWDFLLDSDSAGFVEDYRAIGMAGAPFGLYPELALAVADAMWPGQRTSVERFELTSALVFGPSGRRFVQAALRLEGEASGELRFSSRDDEGADWELHAICRLERADEASCSKLRTAFARGSRGAGEAQAADPFFANLERCGVSLGPKCRTLRELELEASDGDGQRSLLARMMLPRVSEAEWHAYKAHPAILESCFQLVGTLFEPAAAIRPIAIRRISFVRELGSDCWCRIRRWVGDAKAGAVREVAEADLEFFDREGDWLGVIEGVQVEALPEIAGPNMGRVTDLHEMRWVASDQIATDSREEKSKKDVERWVVVSDSSLEAAVFAAELQKEGGSCLFCEKVEDLPLSANRMRADAGRPWGFLLLAWAGGAVQGEREPAAYRDFRVGSWAGAIRDHCEDASQVWIATRGLQRIGNDDRPPIELAPVIAREVETFASCVDMQRCRLFDASAELLQSERVSLAALLGRSAEERQYAGRGAEVYVPRLVEAEIALNVASEGSELAGVRNFRAVHTGKEGLDCLELQQVAEPELGEGEVAVEVSAAALSQLDVLTGLGLGRGPVTGPRVVGMDFAGVVIDVGASDHAYQIGDEVIGVHAGALARRLAVPVTSLAPKPAFFDFNEAAGLPLPNLIAQYALRVVARLRAGERVLLLSAGGGVGQAMVAIARRIGAEVNATASQAERRSALRELGARVLEEFPADSEMGDFDVIVSPDSGDLLHSTLARLAPGGRFLDLCPRNDFVRPEMGSIRLAANRSISAIDVGAMIRTEPTLVSALLEGTAKAARDGLLLPPSMSVFPLSEAGRALRYMAQNRHSGRVVLDMIDAPHQRIIERPTPQRGLEDSGRFVVSGTEPEAQSAIGEWLRDHGARDVVVTSSEGLGIAISESDPPRMGGWIHVTSESTRGADEIRRMMPALAETQIATRTLVSIRAARTGAPPVDRAWETRVWIDQLLLTETKPNARTLTLSIGEDLGARRIAETVGEALSGEMSEASLVRFSDRDRNERVGDARAPVFDLLEEREEKLAGSTFVVSEFLELTPPERRVAMQEFVCDSLANVLALSQEQRNEIDVGSRIDEMGLDSLMTLELFLGIGRDVELEIASDWFVSVPTLSEIASTLIERLDEIACEGS
jgi:NADPH:quinone reductase-like Zn-dependent oxidoreductase